MRNRIRGFGRLLVGACIRAVWSRGRRGQNICSPASTFPPPPSSRCHTIHIPSTVPAPSVRDNAHPPIANSLAEKQHCDLERRVARHEQLLLSLPSSPPSHGDDAALLQHAQVIGAHVRHRVSISFPHRLQQWPPSAATHHCQRTVDSTQRKPPGQLLRPSIWVYERCSRSRSEYGSRSNTATRLLPGPTIL